MREDLDKQARGPKINHRPIRATAMPRSNTPATVSNAASGKISHALPFPGTEPDLAQAASTARPVARAPTLGEATRKRAPPAVLESLALPFPEPDRLAPTHRRVTPGLR